MVLSSFFKNLFGKTQETPAATANADQHTSENKHIEKTENFVEETLNKVKEVSEPILEDAVGFTNHAKDIINDIIDSVKEINSETDDTKPLVYDTVVDISEKAVTSTDND